MAQPEEWLTLQEALGYLKVSKATLHKLRREGKLPSYRIGEREVRFKRSDLDALLTPITTADIAAHVPEQMMRAKEKRTGGKRK